MQKYLRYIGKEADGKTILSSSISDAEITSIKIYGPLLVLDWLAKKINLPKYLGSCWKEILSMVYAHCLDYKSINQMKRWFSRTDLSMLLSMEDVTEARLLSALDTLEKQNLQELQKEIFENVLKTCKITFSGVIYDVTNTYFYGKNCTLAKLGHDKEGVKGRPLIQIGLAVTKDFGIPICHKVFNGNINDAKTLHDFITDLGNYKIKDVLMVFDRGISSKKNLADLKTLKLNPLCGLSIKGDLIDTVRSLYLKKQFISLANRIKLKKTIFYVVSIPYQQGTVKGTLAICFNEQQKKDLRESRYDEILYAQQLKSENKKVKTGMEKFLSKSNQIINKTVLEAEEFDGYSCIFTTAPLSNEEMVRLYFDKDVVEKAFRSIKGIVRLQPIRHWLYNRVISHVFICYLSYLLLSLLEYHISDLEISAEEALIELESMYKVYLKDEKKDFKISRVVTLTKKQEKILKALDKKLLIPSE